MAIAVVSQIKPSQIEQRKKGPDRCRLVYQVFFFLGGGGGGGGNLNLENRLIRYAAMA